MNEKNHKDYWNGRAAHTKDKMALVYNHNQGFARSQEVGEALIKLFVRPQMTVLDLGCGYGRFYTPVTEAGGLYVGMDFSEEMIKIARVTYPKGEFHVGDWWELQGKFDIVFECICLSSYDALDPDCLIEPFAKHLLKFARDKLIMVEPCDTRVLCPSNMFL